MNKKEGLKILLNNPIGVIMDGIRIQEQNYFRKKVLKVFGIKQLPTIDILDLFPNLEETVHPYSFLTGTSLITDIVLLKMLARCYKDGSYLEIGSWRGESIANVSDVMMDCVSVTLSEEEMRHKNYSDDFIKVHGIYSKDKEISQIGHDSKTFDFKVLNKKFDLIFIDGDHSYEGILNDTEKAFSLLKNENSVIVWHDYSIGTEDVRHTTLKAILDGIPKSEHKYLFHVSNTMCAIYLRRNNFNTTYTKFPSIPNKKFSLHVKAEKL
jgi:predicted O-methyltransferase YrrM